MCFTTNIAWPSSSAQPTHHWNAGNEPRLLRLINKPYLNLVIFSVQIMVRGFVSSGEICAHSDFLGFLFRLAELSPELHTTTRMKLAKWFFNYSDLRAAGGHVKTIHPISFASYVFHVFQLSESIMNSTVVDWPPRRHCRHSHRSHLIRNFKYKSH